MAENQIQGESPPVPLYLETLVNVPLHQSFTYSCPPDLVSQVAVGKRVEVRFGNRRMTAFVVGTHNGLPEKLDFPPEKIKPILKVLDTQPLFSQEHIKLSQWMSLYYFCSQGEALATMLPSGRRETEGPSLSLSEGRLEFETHKLSTEQQDAVDNIIQQEEVAETSEKVRSKIHYLYGPTGTGKTEVFLTVAEKILAQGKGVIYLVPEISLTHQVVESVVRRFGDTVAILHSNLSPSQRLKEWTRILKQEATVVIGVRSAVFAPVPNLGLMIIDEEHDGSYKSGTTPRYHARQVAMYRCSQAGIPLVMGSATPSIEAWHLMSTGRFVCHHLTTRLAGGKVPEITCVDLNHNKDGGCLSPLLCDEIRATLKEGRQTILFLNRRGFTHFFRCNNCNFELKCKNCSVALTYHRSQGRLRCHYCGWSTEPPKLCPECGSLDVGYTGFGTEFIEAETKAKFPNARISRIDSDTVSKKGELQEKIQDFRQGKIDILLGTQMVAKGLNFPNLKLVGVVMADTGLHMPDFRAAERTFSLITQVAGRAGRFFPDGRVIVQSFSPQREAIAYACKGDTEGFYQQEIQQREILGFPPFARLVRLVFRSASLEEARKATQDAAHIFLQEIERQGLLVDVMGPAECPLAMIAANHRWQILLRAKEITPLHHLCHKFLSGYKTPQKVYIEVDVDPVSLL